MWLYKELSRKSNEEITLGVLIKPVRKKNMEIQRVIKRDNLEILEILDNYLFTNRNQEK